MSKGKKNIWPSGRVNTPQRPFHRSYRRAFSLVELLMVIVVGGICMAAAHPLLWVFFSTFSQNDEYVSAQENAYNATLALGRVVLLGGLGMPAGGVPSLKGGSPLSGVVSTNASKDSLTVVWSIPTGAMVRTRVESPGAGGKVLLSENLLGKLRVGDVVAFPPTRCFFSVRAVDATGVTLSTVSGDAAIEQFSELHQVESSRFYVNATDHTLRREDRLSANNQPLLGGIWGLSVDVMAGGGAVDVTLLGGSNQVFSRPLAQEVPGWSPRGLPADNRRFVAIRKIWRVRNWTDK